MIADRVLVDENGVTYSEHEKSFLIPTRFHCLGVSRSRLLWGGIQSNISLVTIDSKYIGLS